MGLDQPLHRVSRSPAETLRLGRELGRLLKPGDFVGLIGELGAGKTAFAGGLGEGLEAGEALRSPSYLLCCEYSARHRLLHLDAYFEARMASLLTEGLPDRFRDAIVVVEWADHCAWAWPGDRLEIVLTQGLGPEERHLAASALGPRSTQLLQAWQSRWQSADIPPAAEPGRLEAR